ncbi:hypothetical protein PG985_001462 [Apiospora marii]|uniref:uncharacterized protein n=1 Tax=Apiospora marii TaxID=335849 RepID=UPI003130FFBF
MASGTVAPTETPSGSPMAGSAEFLSRHLKLPGHACGHFPKYRILTSQPHHGYPSRLGFFHDTKSEPSVIYLDTSKLCKNCLDRVVPMGYNYWSMLSAHNYVEKGKSSSTTNHESGYAERKSKWLDAPSSASQYPQLIQARAELSPGEDSTARAVVNQNPTMPITVSIPQLSWASEAWQWLSSQRKPFYIDHLHMIKGWTSLAEAMAARDFLIVERTGAPFIPTQQRDRGKTSKVARKPAKDPRPTDVGTTSAGLNDETLKTTKTTKTTRKKSTLDPRAPDPTPATPPDHYPEFGAAEDLPLPSSIFPGKEKQPTSQIPKQKSKSSPKIAKTDTPPPDSTRPNSAHTQGEEKSAKATGKPQKKPRPRKNEHESSTKPVFSHTSDYNRYEPLPFDSPVKPASLGDYQRGVEFAVRTRELPFRIPPEKDFGKDYSSTKRSKDLRSPDSLVEEEEVMALVGSRGRREQAGPEISLELIEPMVKGMPKLPAASGKTDRPQKAQTTKSSAVATKPPGYTSAQKGPATFKADQPSPPLRNDKLGKDKTPMSGVDWKDPARDKSAQKVLATSKSDRLRKVETPKSKVGSADPSRNKINGQAPMLATLATVNESEDQVETQTVYSDTKSLNDLVILDYVIAFVDKLVRSLPSAFNAAEFERVSVGLDELLQAFSVIIGSDGSTPEYRKLMYLVYRFRK